MSARAALVCLALAACTSSQPPAMPSPSAPPAPGPGTEPRPAAGVEGSVHVALGVPKDADPSDDYLMDKAEFVVSYNARLNAPNWVAWSLERRHLGRAPRSHGFRSDTSLPSTFYVAKDADYAGSGYDRGHLCPSADRTATPAVNAATFVFTNVHPQLHELNAGPWEELEVHERELARRGRALYIVAGGLFDAEPKRIGKEPDPARRVAVPRASYKAIVSLEPGQGPEAVRPDTEAIAVIMPNEAEAKPHAWRDYAVSIRDVERASGYDFDGRVPRAVQDAIEERRPSVGPAAPPAPASRSERMVNPQR